MFSEQTFTQLRTGFRLRKLCLKIKLWVSGHANILPSTRHPNNATKQRLCFIVSCVLSCRWVHFSRADTIDKTTIHYYTSLHSTTAGKNYNEWVREREGGEGRGWERERWGMGDGAYTYSQQAWWRSAHGQQVNSILMEHNPPTPTQLQLQKHTHSHA